ncbi:MAG: hypothetical protein E6Q57_03720, partial [Mycobacterium sp.]
RSAEQLGHEPVLVCAPSLRPAMRSFLARTIPHMPVLSYEELADHLTIDALGSVTLEASNA